MSDSSRIARRRAGFGLLDSIGVIVTTGILLSFAAIVLSRAFMSHAQALDHLQRMQRMQNACDRIRADVHLAISCEVEADSLTLDLSDGRSIRYDSSPTLQANAGQTESAQSSSIPIGLDQGSSQRDGMTLTRVMLVGGQVLGQERLKLDHIRQIRWTIDRAGRVPLVKCELMDDERPPLEWLSRIHLPTPSPVAEASEDPRPESGEAAEGESDAK